MLATGSQPILLGIFGGLGMQEFVIIAIVAVLLFGQKLPTVARTMGSHYNKFRKGISDIQQSVDQADVSGSDTSRSYSAGSYDDYDDYEEATGPKFEPPPSEPKMDDPTPDA